MVDVWSDDAIYWAKKLRGLSEGLNFEEADDRNLFRARVDEAIAFSKVKAILAVCREIAGTDLPDNAPRADVVRELADIWILIRSREEPQKPAEPRLPQVGDLVVDGEHKLMRVAWGLGEGVCIARATHAESVHAYAVWWIEKKLNGDVHVDWYFYDGAYFYGDWDESWDKAHVEFMRRIGHLKGDPEAPHGKR